MPSVNIRVEKVDNAELNAKKQGDETAKSGKGEITSIAVASIFANKAVGVAKSLVNTYVSNIGTFTGNYVKQDNLQRELEAISELASVGVAFATNWVAGVAMVAGMGIKGLVDYNNQLKQNEITRQNTEYLKQRNGNTLEDGSRRR